MDGPILYLTCPFRFAGSPSYVIATLPSQKILGKVKCWILARNGHGTFSNSVRDEGYFENRDPEMLTVSISQKQKSRGLRSFPSSVRSSGRPRMQMLSRWERAKLIFSVSRVVSDYTSERESAQKSYANEWGKAEQNEDFQGKYLPFSEEIWCVAILGEERHDSFDFCRALVS